MTITDTTNCRIECPMCDWHSSDWEVPDRDDMRGRVRAGRQWAEHWPYPAPKPLYVTK